MNYKPEKYNSVSAYLIVNSAQKLIEFMEKAFGARVLRKFDKQDGSIAHAEVMIDDSVVMLADATGSYPAARSFLHVYVPDADEAYKRALAAGAVSIEEPVESESDPDRRATVEDPFGNSWSLGTQVKL